MKKMMIAVAVTVFALSVCVSCKKSPEPQSTVEENVEEDSKTPQKEKKAVRPLTKSVERFSVKGAVFDMVRVKAGDFMMGAQGFDIDAWEGEYPPHLVKLTHDYYIGRCEVTQKLWKAVMGNNPSQHIGDDFPADNITWEMAQQFNQKLTSMTDFRFTLPTEAQWEFAARGGINSAQSLFSGDDYAGNVAWYKDNAGGNSHEVGMLKPNELGLYDMSGNLYEWCSDWYAKYSGKEETDPKGPQSGKARVLRSGSMTDPAKHCRATNRGFYNPNKATGAFGFRIVINL